MNGSSCNIHSKQLLKCFRRTVSFKIILLGLKTRTCETVTLKHIFYLIWETARCFAAENTTEVRVVYSYTGQNQQQTFSILIE